MRMVQHFNLILLVLIILSTQSCSWFRSCKCENMQVIDMGGARFEIPAKWSVLGQSEFQIELADGNTEIMIAMDILYDMQRSTPRHGEWAYRLEELGDYEFKSLYRLGVDGFYREEHSKVSEGKARNTYHFYMPNDLRGLHVFQFTDNSVDPLNYKRRIMDAALSIEFRRI